LLFIPLFNISAVSVSYQFEANNLLIYSIVAPPMETQNILNSMEMGHRAEIEFVIRVYRNRRPRFLRFLRSRLETSTSVSYVATRDLLNGTFTITKSNGQSIQTEDENSFFDTFFSANNIKIDMSGAGSGEYYILSRIEMRVIKLIPPLNLLANIIPGIVTRTDWINVGTFRIN
jgi:hypothetical protein